jgi:hypothetical protein
MNELLGNPDLAERIKNRAEELELAPFDYVLHLGRREMAGAKEHAAIRSSAKARRKGLRPFRFFARKYNSSDPAQRVINCSTHEQKLKVALR